MNTDPQTYAVIGAAMEVHKALGDGYLEAVYHEALTIELKEQNITFSREKPLSIYYKTHLLPCFYKADFICYEEIIVELKAIETLTKREESQILNYLHATKLKRALLINFGSPSLQYKRFVL